MKNYREVVGAMPEELCCQVSDYIATITLQRVAKRNALTVAMLQALRLCLSQLDDADDVRAIILTGSGDSVFCAGADLEEFSRTSQNAIQSHHDRQPLVDLFLTLDNLHTPIIAAINGDALAGGLGLMLACDIAIASESAHFAAPEIRIGIWPMLISALLAKHLTPKQLSEMLLTGAAIDADRAYELGLINQVVAPTAVLPTAMQLAQQITEMSVSAIRAGKPVLHLTERLPYPEALHNLHAQLTLLSQTEDAHEGMRAFLEKRAPKFN